MWAIAARAPGSVSYSNIRGNVVVELLCGCFLLKVAGVLQVALYYNIQCIYSLTSLARWASFMAFFSSSVKS